MEDDLLFVGATVGFFLFVLGWVWVLLLPFVEVMEFLVVFSLYLYFWAVWLWRLFALQQTCDIVVGFVVVIAVGNDHCVLLLRLAT